MEAFYVFDLSINDNFIVARYESNPSTEEPKVLIFAEHVESNNWDPDNSDILNGYL